jgi:hypothetical protein
MPIGLTTKSLGIVIDGAYRLYLDAPSLLSHPPHTAFGTRATGCTPESIWVPHREEVAFAGALGGEHLRAMDDACGERERHHVDSI